MKITELLPLLLLLTFSILSLATSSHHDQSYYEAGKQQQWRQGKSYNPFIFGEESFEQLVSSEHGTLKVSKLFPELSPSLHGITNYRLGCFEADPLTFLLPIHLNADSIFYVAEGEGAIALLREGNRESHSLQKGDIISVWAGSIMYMINKSKSQKLKINALLHPVGNTGNIQVYNSVGSQEDKSYYWGFSIDLLEAALKTRKDRLHQLFGRQNREIIARAPEEKIRAIAERAAKSESGPWPFIRTNKPFNLLNKQPRYQNNRGQLFRADQRDYDQLKDLNAMVSYANISGGSMFAPFFNTRAFKLAVVVKGSGYVEIIRPEEKDEQSRTDDKGEEQQRQPKERYVRVSSQISEGSVFISPPGHPTAIVAGKEQNLQVVCFGVQAENNELVFIAGKNNILGELEEEAKELAFGAPPKMVDEVLRGQEEEVFMAGPWAREEGGKPERPLMESIMKLVEGF